MGIGKNILLLEMLGVEVKTSKGQIVEKITQLEEM